MNEYNDEDIRKAYVEVLEVLKHIPDVEYSKIPKDVIDDINNNKNRFYKFEYKGIESISRIADVILVDLYTKYIADNNKRRLVMDILKLNERKANIKNK